MEKLIYLFNFRKYNYNQRTNGPVNAHLISWPSKAQNIQNLENTRSVQKVRGLPCLRYEISKLV